MSDAPQSPRPATPGARTLVRGLQLLELVAEAEDGARVSDLAQSLGLDRGTVSRLLSTLRECGYVRQRPSDRRYSLSSKLTRLSQGYLGQLDLRMLARPRLAALRDEVNETVHLAIREGNRVTYIDQLEPDRPVRHSSAVGQTLPMHVTAMGRAVLSRLSAQERRTQLERALGEYRYEDFIQDRERLDKELELAVERGWATVDRGDDVTRVGSAICDSLGNPIGAISVSGPSYRVRPEIDHFGERCAAVARQIANDYNS
ncbi:IclR family transcriptional regulator [Streptomyces sp. NPDC058576]|uniref:IclR family transcriptional regulator n=1 Tax=Streptomyces sp. NPDC058576 TaxID=3346547 RepID=UPI003650CD2B